MKSVPSEMAGVAVTVSPILFTATCSYFAPGRKTYTSPNPVYRQTDWKLTALDAQPNRTKRFSGWAKSAAVERMPTGKLRP